MRASVKIALPATTRRVPIKVHVLRVQPDTMATRHGLPRVYHVPLTPTRMRAMQQRANPAPSLQPPMERRGQTAPDSVLDAQTVTCLTQVCVGFVQPEPTLQTIRVVRVLLEPLATRVPLQSAVCAKMDISVHLAEARVATPAHLSNGATRALTIVLHASHALLAFIIRRIRQTHPQTSSHAIPVQRDTIALKTHSPTSQRVLWVHSSTTVAQTHRVIAQTVSQAMPTIKKGRLHVERASQIITHLQMHHTTAQRVPRSQPPMAPLPQTL